MSCMEYSLLNRQLMKIIKILRQAYTCNFKICITLCIFQHLNLFLLYCRPIKRYIYIYIYLLFTYFFQDPSTVPDGELQYNAPVIVWHFCAAYNCSVSTRKMLQCTDGCKIKHANAPCNIHPRAYPELQNIKFLPFPKNTECREKWVTALGRKDLVKATDITHNYRLCSLHFPDRLPVYEDEIPTKFDQPLYLQTTPSPPRSYRTRTKSVNVPQTPKSKENTRTKQSDDTVFPAPLADETIEIRIRD